MRSNHNLFFSSLDFQDEIHFEMFLDFLNIVDDETQLGMLDLTNLDYIGYIKNPSEHVQLECVKIDSQVYKYIKNACEKATILALETNFENIDYLRFPASDLHQKVAIDSSNFIKMSQQRKSNFINFFLRVVKEPSSISLITLYSHANIKQKKIIKSKPNYKNVANIILSSITDSTNS